MENKEFQFKGATLGGFPMLSSEDIVELDDDKKAAIVSNLLVVLCGDDSAQPVVNTGTLNH